MRGVKADPRRYDGDFGHASALPRNCEDPNQEHQEILDDDEDLPGITLRGGPRSTRRGSRALGD